MHATMTRGTKYSARTPVFKTADLNTAGNLNRREIATIIRMYAKGTSLKELAYRFGIAIETVRKALTVNDFTIRPRGRPKTAVGTKG